MVDVCSLVVVVMVIAVVVGWVLVFAVIAGWVCCSWFWGQCMRLRSLRSLSSLGQGGNAHPMLSC